MVRTHRRADIAPVVVCAHLNRLRGSEVVDGGGRGIFLPLRMFRT